MPRLVLALAAIFAITLGASMVAQDSPPFARVEILNTTGEAGKTMADVVLPLAMGVTKLTPMLVTDRGRVCQVEPMGARWRDGSVRYLRVALPVVVSAHERRSVRLFLHDGAPPTFRAHAAVVSSVSRIRMWFRAAGQRVAFGPPVLVENGARVRVWRMRARCKNSCMYAVLDLLVMHDTPNLRFYMQWGNSNPARKALHEDPGVVAFEVQGTRVLFDERSSKLHGQYDLVGGVVGHLLHPGGWIADGQAQCFEGRMVASGGAPRVRAMAHGWRESGAFGPFGELIPEARVDRAWWARRIADDDAAQKRQPWAAARHGCNPNPSNTGDQPDFSTIVMRPDVLLADPSRLRSIARSVFQEWCRPTHYREFNLDPVTIANHPKLILLSGRPHFPAGPGVDLLGKPAEYLDDKKITADEYGRTFRGHDGQHLSINYLCALALTTGDRLVLQECEHHAELWLGEFTHGTGTYSDNPGAARAVGRSLMAGCWLWLVTGRDDLKVRIAQRTLSIVPFFTKKRSGPPALLPNVLVPRWTSSRGHYWPPWEESIAAVGLAGVHSLFFLKEAGLLSEIVATNVVRHGIGFAPWGWRVGYKIPFATAAGKPYYALADPNFTKTRAAGSGLTQWTVPSILLVVRYARDKAARALATRMFLDLIADKRFAFDPRLLEWLPVIPRHLTR